MLYLGAFLVVVSFGVLVITYWTTYSPVLQAVISLSVTGLFYAGGAFARSRLRARHSGTVIVGIGSLLVPLNVVTLAQIFGATRVGWPSLWLVSSLVMLPLNAATAGWLQAEFFGYVALASAVTATVSATSLFLAAPWWGVTATIIGAASVLVSPRIASPFLAPLRRPLHVGGVALGLLAVPWVLWIGGEIRPYVAAGAPLRHAPAVAAAWWAAAALGSILVAKARTREYAYGTATAVCGATMFTAAALAPVPWVGLGLVALAAAGAFGERWLARAGDTVTTAWRHSAWVCAAVGGGWSLASLDTAIPGLAVDAAAAFWWSRLYRRVWLIVPALASVAGSLTAALLRAHVDPATLGVWWSGLGLVYLGAVRFTRLPRDDAPAFYLVSYSLLICAQAPALLWPSRALQVVALGVLCAVSIWSIRLGDRDAGLQTLLNALPRPWRGTLFTWVAAALFPLWALLVWKWRGGADPGAGPLLSAIAFLYAAAAYRLSRAASPRALPLLSMAYLLSALGPALVWPNRAVLSVAFALDTVLLAGLAKGFGAQTLADLSAATSVAAILTAPPAWLAPPGPVWLRPAVLSAVALLYSIAALRAGPIPRLALFGRSLHGASRGLAVVVFLVASGNFADGNILLGLAGYTALALVLAAWSLMDETPWPAVLGATIGAGALTIAVATGRLAGLGVTAGDYGPAWAALALVLGATGIGLGPSRHAAAGLLPVAGTALVTMALLGTVGRPPSEWWTLCFALALFAGCAAGQPRGRLPLVDALVERITRSSPAQARLRAGYAYLSAWMLPFWVWLTLDRIPLVAIGREYRGVALVLLAWVYLGVHRLMKQTVSHHDAPWLTTAPIVAAAGLMIAAAERLPFVIAAGTSTLLCVAFALTLGAPRWLYPAAVLAAPAWVLGLAHIGLPTRLLGPSLLVLAVGDLAIGEWLTRRAQAGSDRIPATALPFWIIGFALIPPALLWASLGGSSVALATFLGGAVVYWAAGLRLRDALFSYPVTALVGLSYIVGLPLVRERLLAPAVSWAVWFLPGVVASMLAAGLLSRTHPPLRARPFFSRSPAAAPVVLASGGAAAVVVLGWSEPGPRVWVIGAAAAVYLLGLTVTYTPRWLYPALLAAHLAYGFGVWDAGRAAGVPLAIWFIPVTIAMASTGVLAARGRDRGEGRRLVERFHSAAWGGPFYVFAGAGLLVSTVAAWANAGALALVLSTGTIIAGGIASWWRDARLGSLSTLLGAAAVLVTFAWMRLPAPAAEPWNAAIALAFGGLWSAALIAARDRVRRPGVADAARFWTGPLRLEAVVLGAVALGGSIAGLLTGVAGSERAVVLCLAVTGFLALEIALIEGHEVLSYAAVLMLEIAWGLWLRYDRGVHEMQFYAVPGAAYLLWVGLAQDRRGRGRLAGVIDGAGLILLLGSSLLQSIVKTQSPMTLVYGGLVAVESLCMLWWGIARQRRRFVAAGTAVLVVDVIAQIVQPLLLMSRWVITGAVGLVLILGALIVERNREIIARISQRVRTHMEAWYW